MAKLPVIDFSKEDCLKPGTSSWLSIRNDVCRALEELGCFEAIMPGDVSSELQNNIFGAINNLFDAPAELKAKNRYEENPYCGHFTYNTVHEGLGVNNPTNIEETQKFAQLFWPEGNDQFCNNTDVYAKVMRTLDQAVTRMVFENYGVEIYHDNHIQSTSYFVQFTKYKEPEKVGTDEGLASHTDKNFSTVLHQNLKGLEINIKDDEWIMFDPHVPSSFLFLAGDIFQVWSNDRVRPGRHRVNMKGNDKPRYSIGLFATKVGETNTPEELVDEDHPLKYKTVNQSQLSKENWVFEGAVVV